MKVYIINCEASEDRRSHQEQQCARLNIKPTFFSAVTPKDLSADIIQKHASDWLRPMRVTEMACYFSHSRLWEQVAAANEAALILEDDTCLSHYTPAVLAQIQELEATSGGHDTDIDVINLELCSCKKYLGRSAALQLAGGQLEKPHKLYRNYMNRAGAGAYVLFPRGARKLLANEQQNGIGLVDAQIYHPGRLQAYQVEPACAIQFVCCAMHGLETHGGEDMQRMINYDEPYSKSPKFFFKRAARDIWLGLYKLKIFFKTRKRFITIHGSDFTF